MQSGRRRAIALLMNVAGMRDDYEGGIRRGVEQACEEYDLDLYIYAGRSTYDETSKAQQSVYRLIDKERIDAVIVASGVLASHVPVDELAALVESYRPIPVVTIGPSIAGAAAVLVDNQAAAREVVEHLVEVHGRREFVCISGPAGNPEAGERLAVYRSTLKRYGLALPDEAVADGQFSEEGGAAALRELIRRGLRFDAVLASNDFMAVGALHALQAAGRHCPRDVAVVGFDDAAASRYCEPPVTTARQPLASQGGTAVELVRQCWAGGPRPRDVVHGVRLVVRESCGCGSAPQPSRGDDATESSRQERIVRALVPVLAGPIAADHAARLADGLVQARAGHTQSLVEELHRLFSVVTERATRIDLLPAVVEQIRSLSSKRTPDLEDIFHWAQVEAGRRVYRAQGRRNVEAERTVYDVRLAWERLAAALDLDRLSEAMGDALSQRGVSTAVVSTYVDGSLNELQPLVAVHDGRRFELDSRPYLATRLMPPEWPVSDRHTLSVMPLTFQRQQLGVVVLETGNTGFYDLLREQIGGAIKRAAIHGELIRQTRLHARSLEEERATAERLRSLYLVAGGVAHDLNNVLGPLVALPEAIRRDLEASRRPEDTPRAVLEDLETMQTAAHRASLTIRDLMDLGRPSAGRTERIDLSGLLGGVLARHLEDVVRERNPSVRLVVETATAPVVVRASESHLERCVTNLALNAADAISGTGTVSVRVRVVTFDESRSGFETVAAGTYACLEVQDTGVGIPPDRLHRVVEPFYSQKRRSMKGGTGLGLAIVQRFVKDAGGYLDIESTVGQGTIFRIYLPQGRVSGVPSRIRSIDGRGRGERILVVDDEPVQRRSARRVLQALGYDVTCVASGEEALELYRAPQAAEFGLVILDMVMGEGLDGIETYRRILDTRPDQRAMIASGYASEQKGSDVAALGLKWLTKPYTFDGLGAAVREVLED